MDPALPGTLRERRDFDLSGGLGYYGIRDIYKKGSVNKQLSP
jgi:hypothetical protein